MFTHFLCLCPLRLAIMLNFDISKVAYCTIIIIIVIIIIIIIIAFFNSHVAVPFHICDNT